MPRLLSLLFVVLALGCGTASGRPEAVARPRIDLRLIGNPYFGSASSAPATIEVEVQNAADVPIVVRRIEIDSPGMAQYRLVRTAHIVRETIAPGEAKTISLMVAVVRSTTTLTEPLTMRALIDFEAGKDVWREVVMTR